MDGLYGGDFIGYRVPGPEEVDAALREAVVAIDANVLLNLYRYRAQTSRDLIKVLESLGDRLVVPHQAMREFWRHRQRSQGSPQAATNTALESVVRATRAVKLALEGWAKQVGVDAEELGEIVALVGGFEQEMARAVLEVLEDVGERAEGDYILDQLDRVLDGRVTDALAMEDLEKCVAEGRRRIEAEEPPGYKDADKEDGESSEGGAGDYLVWVQATRHAHVAERDLVLVTADEKEDWWWRQQSRFIGPRPELVLEFYRLGGRRLFLLRPSDLLAKASVLQVEVNEESSADADRAVDGEIATPWTLDALEAVLEHLDREAPVQAAALRLATPEHGGQVSRDEVYELGSYSDDRMLRGFTRPVRRLTELLQDAGTVPGGVSPLLVARYPDGVKTSYFSVPPEVPQLLQELADGPTSSPAIALPPTGRGDEVE